MTDCIDDHHSEPGHVCNHGPSSMAESLDEIEFNRSIHAACIANNLDRVKSILDKGTRGGVAPADAFDSSGYTALHYASRAGNKEICTLLLTAGADVDAKTPELGATPLMRAVQQCHLLVVRLLISFGADLELVNSDQENIFHTLAKAAAAKSSSQNQGQDRANEFLELARWLRMKAKSQPERLQRMLRALDRQGKRPLDYLQDRVVNNSSTGELIEILTPQDVTAQ
ncbi:Ankyrin repeat domain-containing protein 39 [Gryganskiella cystojenkinii]|nr:Ankyrin repeat domain-containing protein 39 [Gryganskiella cystojenkinii]